MKKKSIRLIAMLITMILYYVVTDPDSKIITDMAYGADAVRALGFLVVGGLAGFSVDVMSKFWLDTDSDETKLIQTAVNDKHAGDIYIGNSIRILGFCIIATGTILVIFN